MNVSFFFMSKASAANRLRKHRFFCGGHTSIYIHVHYLVDVLWLRGVQYVGVESVMARSGSAVCVFVLHGLDGAAGVVVRGGSVGQATLLLKSSDWFVGSCCPVQL